MRTRPYRPNRNGWTDQCRAAFLAVLAAGHSVTATAASVGMSRESAYWLRRQPGAVAFRQQWDAATVFVFSEALDESLEGNGPETWSTDRLARRLQRRNERAARADCAKV